MKTASLSARKHCCFNPASCRCSGQDIRDLVRDVVIATLPDGWMCDEDKFYVNPTGQFIIGGPDGDAGLTAARLS